MEWIEAGPWWMWLVAALVLAGIEILLLDLLFLMLAAGALGGMVASLLGAPLAIQAIVFAVVSLGMLAAVRPVALRHLRQSTPESVSYLESLPGRRLQADSPVDGRDGRIRLDGEVWSARVEPGHPDVAPGTQVDIVAVDGASLIVRPVPSIDWDSPDSAAH